MYGKIVAWTTAARGAMFPAETPLKKALGPYCVEVIVSHCGICRSDLLFLANDWGIRPVCKLSLELSWDFRHD